MQNTTNFFRTINEQLNELNCNALNNLSTSTYFFLDDQPSQTLLKCIKTKVLNASSNCLFDDGSTSSYITKELALKLKLKILQQH